VPQALGTRMGARHGGGVHHGCDRGTPTRAPGFPIVSA
jgi:hypothetical protein